MLGYSENSMEGLFSGEILNKENHFWWNVLINGYENPNDVGD